MGFDILIKKPAEKMGRKVYDEWRGWCLKIYPIEINDEDFMKLFTPLDSKPRWMKIQRGKHLTGLTPQGAKSDVVKRKKFLEWFRENTKNRFFSNWEKFNSEDFLFKYDEQILADADRICEHMFNLLGSDDMDLGAKIDWHIDFKSGYRWNPKRYYKHIEIPYGKADIKVPWELSRFQHLTTLGRAYWITNNEKYKQEFINQISDWIENNPFQFGVNWACTMEVAIRAMNWIFGFYLFFDPKEISNEFWVQFLKNLFLHGRFIRENLEIGYNGKGKRITTNHYLSNIAGLVFLGIFFKDTKEGNEWLDFGIKELANEMEFQVRPDGADFESSIPYHRLATELFSYSALLCKLNDIKLSDYFWNKLKKMFDFVAYYLKPDGKAPQIGDNDNGRLYILKNYYNRSINDHCYLFDLAHEIWPDYQPPIPKSKEFPHSGYYVMRQGNNYMIISTGEVGTNGIGNHKHNDILSFELQIGKQDFIVDPGTYVYTSQPEWRNRFRSSAYHNTVVVDDEEMNRFNEKELFRMYESAHPKINTWKVTDDYDFFDGEHHGYERLKNPVTHRRQIYFDKKESYWVVKDILTGKGQHTFGVYFHFAPMDIGNVSFSKGLLEKAKSIRNPLLKEKFYVDKSLIVESRRRENPNILVIPVNTSFDISLEIEDGWVSYSYGIKVKAPVAIYAKKATLPVEFVTILYPIL